jgi:hypothetical protein
VLNKMAIVELDECSSSICLAWRKPSTNLG